MSDATLGTLILLSPIIILVLVIGPSRRALFAFVRLLIRFVGILLAVIGILMVGGETRKLLLASIYKHAGEPSETPGRHAAEHAELALTPAPAPVVAHRPIDDAARYEGMYERQENSWTSP
jgi:hypothetical protein